MVFVWWPYTGNLKWDESQKGGRYPLGISNQQLQELTAGAALGVALQGEVSIQELQAALMQARQAGVNEARLEEAELKLGRLETNEALNQAQCGQR